MPDSSWSYSSYEFDESVLKKSSRIMGVEMEKTSKQLLEQNKMCLAQLSATMDVNELRRPMNF